MGHMQANISDEGRADAIIVWWDLHLDSQQHFKLSTAPAWATTSAAQSKDQAARLLSTRSASTSAGRHPIHALERSAQPSSHLPTASPESRPAAGGEGMHSVSIADRSTIGLDASAALRSDVSKDAEGPDVDTTSDRSAAQDRSSAEPGVAPHRPSTCRQGWRDHWKTCWAPVAEAPAGCAVSPGQVFVLQAAHDETSITLGASFRPGQRAQPLADQPAAHAGISAPEAGTSQVPQQSSAEPEPDNRPLSALPGASQHESEQPSAPQSGTLVGQTSASISKSGHSRSESRLQDRRVESLGYVQGLQDLLQPASPARTWVLHQQQYWRRIMDGLVRAADTQQPGSVCLILGDSPKLAVMAASQSYIGRVLCVLASPS